MLSQRILVYFCSVYLFYYVKNTYTSLKSTQLASPKITKGAKSEAQQANEWKNLATSIYDEEQDIPVTFASNIMSNFSFEDADWFAGSIEPRMVHPEHVFYSVGEIVNYVSYDQLGVVVGWDETYSGPKDLDEPQDQTEEPFYLILLDYQGSDIDDDSVLYVSQNELAKANHPKKIYNEFLDDFFESFSGGRYQMRPWLQNIYPKDIS